MDSSTDDLYEHLYYRYTPVAVIAFFITITFYYVITPPLSRRYCKNYTSFSPTQLADWNTRTISTINATVVACLGMYDLVWNQTMQDNPIWGHSEAIPTKYASAVLTGYVTADLIIVVKYYPLHEVIAYGIHHIVVVYSVGHILVVGALPYFIAYRLLAELSTPFINIWSLLTASGYPKNHPYAVVSGLAMTFVFFGCRIAAMPLYYYKMYCSWGTPEFYQLPFTIRISWCICGAVLDTLNIMWFAKLIRGATKQLVKMKKQRKEVSNKAA